MRRPRTTTHHSPLTTRSPRGGVTLTEVLVSLMLMSIGVVTLATLFPLAVLRAVQATQLTSATILRSGNPDARRTLSLASTTSSRDFPTTRNDAWET